MGFFRINKEIVLSFTLGFVVLYFGAQEILFPEKWTVFAPEFLGSGKMLINLVIFHGILLVACGLALAFNFHRRITAIVLCFMLVQIIITLFLIEGLSEIVVRDIGLLGMAFALSLKN